MQVPKKIICKKKLARLATVLANQPGHSNTNDFKRILHRLAFLVKKFLAGSEFEHVNIRAER